MGFFKKISGKVTGFVKERVSETVIENVKDAAMDILPVAVGIGLTVVGFAIAGSSGGHAAHSAGSVAYRTMNVTTNNYIFGNDVDKDLLKGLLDL